MAPREWQGPKPRSRVVPTRDYAKARGLLTLGDRSGYGVKPRSLLALPRRRAGSAPEALGRSPQLDPRRLAKRRAEWHHAAVERPA